MNNNDVNSKKGCLKDLLKNLTRTERVIVALHCYEEMMIPEIINSLELSQHQVSQMHASIINRVKAHLRERRLL